MPSVEYDELVDACILAYERALKVGSAELQTITWMALYTLGREIAETEVRARKHDGADGDGRKDDGERLRRKLSEVS